MVNITEKRSNPVKKIINFALKRGSTVTRNLYSLRIGVALLWLNPVRLSVGVMPRVVVLLWRGEWWNVVYVVTLMIVMLP